MQAAGLNPGGNIITSSKLKELPVRARHVEDLDDDASVQRARKPERKGPRRRLFSDQPGRIEII
jgi:hypothetical protein